MPLEAILLRPQAAQTEREPLAPGAPATPQSHPGRELRESAAALATPRAQAPVVRARAKDTARPVKAREAPELGRQTAAEQARAAAPAADHSRASPFRA